MAMLEVNHLAIQFGGLRAVDGFNVSIEKGQLYGLIGPNGAGKTTIFNLLTGAYKPTEGIIKLDGQDITGKSTIEINKAGIARTFQNIRLFKDMPVLDNVKVGLHNHHSYSTLTGILRLPKYHKVEKEMNEKAMEILKAFDLDKEAETKKKAELSEKRTADDDAAKALHTHIESNTKVLANIQAKVGDLDALEKHYTWLKALSNTANGNISGKEKVMLETYIQMTYFDRIIARANTRFMVMSGGQYELKRRKEAENNRSQSGLDLDVIDHYNGTERSVKTLSGGESFKASLSLALGLSDEIQASAGGVKLDTMFVDEGFGSLDEESIDQAMKALLSLVDGNRLVGIISHVADLKNRIDKQIVVTKEKSGGSKAQIIS